MPFRLNYSGLLSSAVATRLRETAFGVAQDGDQTMLRCWKRQINVAGGKIDWTGCSKFVMAAWRRKSSKTWRIRLRVMDCRKNNRRTGSNAIQTTLPFRN